MYIIAEVHPLDSALAVLIDSIPSDISNVSLINCDQGVY